MRYTVNFSGKDVVYHFGKYSTLQEIIPANAIVLTDNHVAALYPELVNSYSNIVIPSGETHKNSETVTEIIKQLLEKEAHRKTMLVGIGGGVVTDITGYIASVYMRGIPHAFVPTTLLGMADAAIGGKNGVNFGQQKNLIGCIKQPEFILFDTSFLQTLPDEEWSNGFAEIIKYACLFDKVLFDELALHDIAYYKQNEEAPESVIKRSVDWKNKIVQEDERESNKRKLLNFGHTAGHAIEKLYDIPHGHAVAIGMLIACNVSEQVSGLERHVKEKLAKLLQQYALPTHIHIETQSVMNILKMDKKRNHTSIDYVTLQSVGAGQIETISFEAIEKTLEKFVHESSY